MNKYFKYQFDPQAIIEDFNTLNKNYLLKNNLFCIPQVADEFHIDENFLKGMARVLTSNPTKCFTVIPFFGDGFEHAADPLTLSRDDVDKLEKIFRELFGAAILIVNTEKDFILFTTYNDYRLVAGSLRNLKYYFEGIDSGVSNFENHLSKTCELAKNDIGAANFLKLLEVAKSQYILPEEP
ncbi:MULTISPECIES: hypothetical protein [Rothia]|uniref:Uncharacterized protein n=1 Tax=Rothia nasimurium TaxID=85336 RepID=A0A1Y1RT90_9MICC|nr:MULTISPECIES: hypothetical protein [Rothia]ORC24455.1 hypothetical protein A7979_09890 [Rothia nasimurium]